MAKPTEMNCTDMVGHNNNSHAYLIASLGSSMFHVKSRTRRNAREILHLFISSSGSSRRNEAAAVYRILEPDGQTGIIDGSMNNGKMSPAVLSLILLNFSCFLLVTNGTSIFLRTA